MRHKVSRASGLLLLIALAAFGSANGAALASGAAPAADNAGKPVAVAQQMKSGGYGCDELTSYADLNLTLRPDATDGAKCSARLGTLWVVTFDDNHARDAFRKSFSVGDSSGIVYTYGDKWVVEAGSRAALKPAAVALGTHVLQINAN